MNERCFAVVVTKSHLTQALAVSHSLRAAGNPETLHVLVVDAEKIELGPVPDGMEYHGLGEFSGEFPEKMLYYFDAFELCNAMRPFLMQKLLQKGAEAVIYLDSDIFVVGSFEPVWETLRTYPIVQTPHVLCPPAMHLGYIDEISIVDQGILNSGFSAWKNHPASLQALDWMKQRFPRYVFMRRTQGMWGDQKLMPFIANYFPEAVLISRDPALNVAFWNAQERQVVVEPKNYAIKGRPVVFFHMSGYRLEFPGKICSYFSEKANDEILRLAPWFGRVIRDYGALLKKCGADPNATKKDYKYGYYRGIKLNPLLRSLLFKKGGLRMNDPDVWKILLIEKLRLIKRWLYSCLRR